MAERSSPAELPVVVLSHRGPVSFSRQRGQRTVARGGGGLVTALVGLAGRLTDAVWVCAASTSEDVKVMREHDGAAVGIAMQPQPHLVAESNEDEQVLQVRMVELDSRAHDDFYGVIANPLLWFLQHGMYGLSAAPNIDSTMRSAFFDGYLAVNEVFATAVVEEVQARGGKALVMLHDYHFYPVAGAVRRECPDAVLSHFVHIPWPGPDGWRVLPPDLREPLLHGLLGNDVVAFHTEAFARNFLLCAQELLHLPVNYERMTVRVGERTVAARYYPISVDIDALAELAASEDVERNITRMEEDLLAEGRKLIVRVDRTDPSKNIVRGFLAFETLLEQHPELVGEVTFLAFLQPSRQDVPEYADYLARIGATVARINARFAHEGHEPVDLRLQEDLSTAMAAYAVCDVLMVNSLADGMNLVAKEAVTVSRRDGVLALSESTGAFQELGHFAVTLYPFDIQQQADALWRALTMDPAERRERRSAAAAVVAENHIGTWLATQLADLTELTGLPIPSVEE
ncbi:glycosyltransferase family 20 protein [soil metagenome]